MSKTRNQTYFQRRMSVLGVTEENNSVQLRDTDRETGGQLFDQQIFEEDKDGNIVINYWNLDGQTINYWLKNNSKNSYTDKYRHWGQKRLRKPVGDMKYQMPAKQGHYPFIPWQLIEKFRKGERIDTLYLTEGAFKAYYAANLGVPVIGLPSITCYKEKDGTLYRDVRRLIEACHVMNVVILFDADCRDISVNAILEGEELTTRPNTFLSQIEKMRELIRGIIFEKGRTPPNVHFMHPNRGEFETDPKGLDDLLITAGHESDKRLELVLEDLRHPERKGNFFFRMNISSTALRLGTYFGLKKGKEGAAKFYSLHAEKIKRRNFYFFGDLYVYINAKEGVELVTPGWADGVLWVGNDFFWKCRVPSAKEGRDRYKLLPRKKETISAVLQDKDFTRFLPYYTDFVNKPSHFDYQAVVELNGQKFYNRYFPFEHETKTGECQTIINFVKHIFGETMVIHPLSKRAVPRYQMGLDYMQILLQEPTQILPVLCLYSQENSTGKSTFCKLLARIFRNNAIFVSNADLQSDFNSVFADKLLVMCEETLLQRKQDTERIKNLSTADEITVNEKNVSQYVIDFFTKFIFCSNNRRMINVDSHDERFWIIQVPKATTEIPDLLDHMTEEIPAFLHFLKERKLATKKEGRMWFYPPTIRTENFRQLVEVNEPGEVSNVRTGIRDLFDAAPEGTRDIRMPMKYIKQEFFSAKSSDRWVKEVLKDYLGVIQPREKDGTIKSVRGQYWKEEKQFDGNSTWDSVLMTVKWAGRPYVFPREIFFPEEQIPD